MTKNSPQYLWKLSWYSQNISLQNWPQKGLNVKVCTEANFCVPDWTLSSLYISKFPFYIQRHYRKAFNSSHNVLCIWILKEEMETFFAAPFTLTDFCREEKKLFSLLPKIWKWKNVVHKQTDIEKSSSKNWFNLEQHSIIMNSNTACQIL